MDTKAYKIYGRDGHRQRESFHATKRYDWSTPESFRIVELINSDVTGTNDYTIVRITRNTAAECREELEGQLSDGLLEDSRYGRIEEINPWGVPALRRRVQPSSKLFQRFTEWTDPENGTTCETFVTPTGYELFNMMTGRWVLEYEYPDGTIG